MKNRTIQSRGFTLVELLVSLGIFMVMTGVVLANYRGYNTNALFANASEDIVLALRQAQVYGVGVKGCGAANPFDCAYGVYFSTAVTDTNGDGVIDRNQLKLFADTNADRIFNSGEDVGLTNASPKWGSGIYIDSVSCDAGPCGGGVANVTFKRPNPDAFIRNNISDLGVSFNLLTVTVRDVNTGKTAPILISKTGQISLQ